MEHQAHDLLRAWRGRRDLSQADLADVLGVSQPAVAQWEAKGRPALMKALEIEGYSGGDVPAVAWGYKPDAIERVRRALGATACPVDADHAAPDFATPPGEAVDDGPRLVRDSYTQVEG